MISSAGEIEQFPKISSSGKKTTRSHVIKNGDLSALILTRSLRRTASTSTARRVQPKMAVKIDLCMCPCPYHGTICVSASVYVAVSISVSLSVSVSVSRIRFPYPFPVSVARIRFPYPFPVSVSRIRSALVAGLGMLRFLPHQDDLFPTTEDGKEIFTSNQC